MDFSFHSPADIRFGRGKADLIGAETARVGRRAFIVTGRSSASTGLLERAQRSLENAGVESVVYDRITQNPLTTSVEEGARLLKESGCDCILAIGGGSPLDAAKGIAVLAGQGGEIDDYIFKRFQGIPAAVPIIAVPTTCGTGSESNGTAVLSNPVTLDKKSLSYPTLVPRCSIVDPSLMETIPRRVMGQVTFDALCHSMESYFSPSANPFTEPLAMDALLYLAKYIVRANDDVHDAEAVDAVTLASTMAGAAFYVSGLQAPHGMEHPLSGMRNIPHGRGLAALTPVIYEHSISGDPAKFAFISRALGGTDENDCARTIRQLLGRIDLEVYLSDEGFTEDDVPWLVDNCFKVSRGRVEGHVKPLDREEVRQIYLEAL
ncbi:MAG: iron-containing alcohol dehydrogenase [archaeon]|nr:iron-containing alcohol dehydrogenase [archaeon]